MKRQILSKSDQASFNWFDIENSNELELEEIGDQFKIHPHWMADCLQPEHLPKFESDEGFSFGIIRYFDSNCSSNADEVQKISNKVSFFLAPDYLLTIHKLPASIINESIIKAEEPRYRSRSFNIACFLIKRALLTYQNPLDLMEKEVDSIENKIFLKKRFPELLKNLYFLKRRSYNIKKLVNLTGELVYHLKEGNIKNPYWNDLHDTFKKIETLADGVYENIQALLSIYLSLSGQRTNEVMRVLTVFSALFMPPTFIVGLYGMNFEFMPELQSPLGYPITLLIILASTIGILIWFKRKNWL